MGVPWMAAYVGCRGSDEVWDLIEDSDLITLPMVLFVLTQQDDPSSALRPQGRNQG